MLAILRRYLAYRRLRPVVTQLPLQLETSFGGGDTYTTLQVQRAIADLHLPRRVWLHAFALACSAQDLDDDAYMSAETYAKLRAEMADLFDLPDNFTMQHLQSKSFTQHHPAPENFYAGSGGGHP